MDFSLSEEQREIQQAIRKILGDLVTDERHKALEREGSSFDRTAFDALAEAGMLGLAIPEAYDGAGLGLLESILLLQETGRKVARIPALESAYLAASILAEFGSEEQKAAYLPKMASGELILTAALAEVGVQDPKRPKTRAEVRDGGWALSGEFTNVPFVEEAMRVLVPARLGDGAALFLVDPKAEGVTLLPQRGTNGAALSLLRLDNVRVEMAARVATEPANGEAGSVVVSRYIDLAMVGMCALEYGIADEALRMTAGYASERKQFHVPIGAFQAVKQRLGDAYIDCQAMEVSLLRAAFLLSQGRDATREIFAAKYWAALGGARVLAAAQHIHGGMGFDRDYPLHRYFLQSKHLELSLGGASASLARLGEALVERGFAPS